MVGDGGTRVLENLSAAAIDPTPADFPQHKRRRGLPVADAVPAGFIPYADDGFVALPAEVVPLPSRRPDSSAHAIAQTPCASASCATPLAPVPFRGPIPAPSPVPFPGPSPAPSALAQTPSQTPNRPPPRSMLAFLASPRVCWSRPVHLITLSQSFLVDLGPLGARRQARFWW